VLIAQGAKVDYWKTGHSYMKRRTNQIGAIAGFEKSGHFFLRAPYGRGYDDGLVSALAVLTMMDHAPGKTIADLYRDLPKTWGTPTMAPHCDDEKKYDVVARAIAHFEAEFKKGGTLAGQKIINLVTVNGVRVMLADGSWGLIRASSNKPELVVVCESPVSEAQMRAVFAGIDGHLQSYPEVGEYNQKI
jgi:phosphomannomutase/phosphoglucomutase